MSVVDQDNHRSTISTCIQDEPGNIWIPQILDFKPWESAYDTLTRLLSELPGNGPTDDCSDVIDLAKVSRTNSSVLYIFFPTAIDARCLIVMTLTLLHQIVSSNVEKADSITATCLGTWLDGHFQRPTQAFKKYDKQEA
ncbi:hypothetical protein BDD12DRAFT_886593 [Trichophaea hybrida]|nr:hypothetical protein BDD12DRAFT_886593 [Trichophaea hybrida]